MKKLFLLLAFNAFAICSIADPGISNSINVCPQEPAFNLISALLGSPDAGGVWTNSIGESVSETFTPGVSPADVYTYTVSTPEGPESATVTIAMADCSTIPANNQCLSTQFIMANSAIPFTTYGATTDGLPHLGEINCEINGLSQIENDVWFFCTTSCNGTATISTVGGTTLNTKIAVYAFNCPATTNDLLGCSEDFGTSVQSQVTWPVVTNGVYLIRIGESPGPGSGNGTFSYVVNCDGEVPPVNDNCDSPTVISPAAEIPFTTLFATTDGPSLVGNMACEFEGEEGIGKDVWYSYTASCDGSAVFNAIGGTFFDSRVAIYSESCPTGLGSLIACNDDSDGFPQSYVQWDVFQGITYTIRLGGIPNFPGGTGTFELLELCENISPPNDNCDNAQIITPALEIAFSTFGATTDGPSHFGDENCSQFGQNQIDLDVWYHYTASCDGLAEVTTVGGTNLDTRIAVYALYCPNDLSNLVICNDDDASFQSTVNWTVVEGESYLIRIGEYPGEGGGSGTFDLTETCMDVCAMPVINYQVFCNGLDDFNSYYVLANVVTIGNNPPYQITSSQGGSMDITAPTQINLGPFANGMPVQFDIVSLSNEDCSESTTEFVNDCFPENTNETCFDAIAVSTNTLISFSNASSETDGDPLLNPFCGLSDVYNDLWYTFTAACTGEVTVTTCPSADFNTAISVYQYSCDDQAELLVGCSASDDCSEMAATVTAETAQGITYLVRIGGLGPDDSGNGVFIIEEVLDIYSAGNDTLLNICQGSVNNLVLNQWISGENSGGVWTDDDNTEALLGNVLFLTSLPGTGVYHFTYTVDGPCNSASSTLTVNYQLCSGISEEQRSNRFVVFPNPATERIFISSESHSGFQDVQILDVSGRVVWSNSLMINQNVPIELELDNSMSAGLYFIQIYERATGHYETHKLVVNGVN
jgi:hypothetical protein